MEMNIRAIEKNYNVEIKSADAMIREMKPKIKAFEKKYQLTSEEMIERVRQNPAFETEEVCIWMQNYKRLQRVANGHNQIGTGGTHTKITNKSTIPV
jgi:hypothetical protein